MMPLSSYQKLFIISVVCAMWMSSLAAPADDSDKPATLLDEIKTIIPANDNQTYIRSKRFYDTELYSARIGTKWCLDQITNPDSNVRIGLYFQTDRCCRTHVRCTRNERDILFEKYPTKSRDVRDETFRSCVCDDEFRTCLKDVAGITFKAEKVGNYYFNHLARTCRNDVLDIESNRAY